VSAATYPTTSFSAPASSAASSALSSTTSRPPPSSGTRMTIPRPSLVTSIGPSPVRGFIAAIAHPHPVVIWQLAGSIIPYHLVVSRVGLWLRACFGVEFSPVGSRSRNRARNPPTSSSLADDKACLLPSPQHGGARFSDARSSHPERWWREATGHVIVDQADRLHHRVRRGRTEKAEAETLEISRHGD
jgi:hypothetical protein